MRAVRNPWSEDKKETHSPCRRCGGEGFLPAFNYREKGVCFKCGGTGLKDKDWRCGPYEEFLLMGAPVRIYTIKGNLKALVKEKDILDGGTPVIESVASLFFHNRDRVSGAHLRVEGPKNNFRKYWVSEPNSIPVPRSTMLAAYPDYFEIRWPSEDESQLTLKQKQERAVRWETIRDMEIRMGRKLQQELQKHYFPTAGTTVTKNNPLTSEAAARRSKEAEEKTRRRNDYLAFNRLKAEHVFDEYDPKDPYVRNVYGELVDSAYELDAFAQDVIDSEFDYASEGKKHSKGFMKAYNWLCQRAHEEGRTYSEFTGRSDPAETENLRPVIQLNPRASRRVRQRGRQ